MQTRNRESTLCGTVQVAPLNKDLELSIQKLLFCQHKPKPAVGWLVVTSNLTTGEG